MKTRRPFRFPLHFWAVWLFGALALGACRPLFQRELAGPVLSLEGSAQETRDGKSVALTTPSWVHPGDTITTAAGARLALLLVPGVLVELVGDTEMEIDELRLTRNGNENIHPMLSREATIRLRRGTLVGALSESQKRSKMTLQTNAGTLTVFDLRTFKIKVDKDRTRILSVRGNAIFQPAGGGPPATIGAGFFAEWPANPEPHAALSDRNAQAEVTQILRTEKRLFHLQKQFGLTFVPWRP